MKNEEVLLRNNTGNKSKETLIDGFAIRIKEFQSIFLTIRNSKPNKIQPHFLIIGQRGAGKTTLLHRLKYAIDDDPELSASIIPIIFTEEQYQLTELTNLWESIGDHLEDFYGWNNATKHMEGIIINSNDYQEEIFNYIEAKLLAENRRLTIFIENVNVFFKKIGNKELDIFKSILNRSKVIQLIGSSTSFFDGFINFNTSYFDFFKIVQLEGLSKEESESLLLKIGEQYGEEAQIKNIITNYPGRIESLRRLTGGIPRTISYLFQIFLDNENGKAIKDLYILIDTLTFLYKSELDQLSSQQQKVIDVIARKWDAIAVKEIARLTRFESKNISSILSTLEKNQFIEIVPTNGKNHLYRIKERFMNIWYLMRYGRKHDRDNIVWLVRFFDAWCDETELARRIADHIKNLRDGQYDMKAAIDMGNTFLSCENVPETLKLQLYKITKSKLPDRMHNELTLSSKSLDKTFQNLVKEEKYDQAVVMLNEIDQKDLHYYNIAYNLYFLKGEFAKSAEAAKKVVELDIKDNKAALRLGIMYEEYLSDIDSAIEWLKISLDRTPSQSYAAKRLGDIFSKYLDDIEEAEVYYRQALKRGFKAARLSIGKMYIQNKMYPNAEAILLEAAQNDTPGAYTELGQLYVQLRDNKKVKAALEKAIILKEEDAKINIAKWYTQKKRPNFKKAKEYLETAIQEGDLGAYSELAELYENVLQDDEMALTTYREGINKGDSESAHQLGHFYAMRNDFTSSDAMFAKAMEMGNKISSLCWITEIYSRGRKDKKAFALELMEQNLTELNGRFRINLLHARLLLWNDRIEESRLIVMSTLSDFNFLKEAGNKLAESRMKSILSQLSSYFLLLLAKDEYTICLNYFENHDLIDFKTLMKPIYFVLMEFLKKDYPLEYLKAGDEFKETIYEIKEKINKLKNNV